MGNRNLNILLIGESGHGKSAFIRSLLDRSGQFIDSTGDKQTTRTSMLYRINAKKEDRTIIITLRDMNSFREIRMARLIEGLERIKMDTLKNDFENFREIFPDNYVLKDEAFFHICEFDKKNELEREYNKIIRDNNNEQKMYIEMAGKSDDEKEAEEKWNDLFENMYELCSTEIREAALDAKLIKKEEDKSLKIRITFDKDGIIQNADSDKAKSFLTKCFKVLDPDDENQRRSFSALVERIDVICPASDALKKIMDENDLDSLTMVDTYGINHEGDNVDEDKLRDRFIMLMDEFSDEKQEISIDGFDYALYINKLNDQKNDFAPQLKRYIPAIVAARSSVMCYVVLTGSDILLCDEEGSLKSPDERFKENRDKNQAYKILSNRKDPLYSGIYEDNLSIQQRLKEQNISLKIIKSRIQAMVKYLTLYCANFKDKKAAAERDFLENQNREGLSRLLFAMTQRIHLGDNYVSCQQMENEGWKDILSIDKLFNSKQPGEESGDQISADQMLENKYIHHSIIYALGRRYSGDTERKSYNVANVTVGYYSPAIGPVGYLNPWGDQSILKTPLANAFKSNFKSNREIDIPDEQFSTICEVMNRHLDELLCHEKKGIMKPAVCSRCPAKDLCLSYQIYRLSGLMDEKAWKDSYTSIRKTWKEDCLNMSKIIKRATDDQKQKLQECIMTWFEEIIKDDILNEYNPARLAIILNAQKEDDINGEMLKDKTIEYIKCIYGKEYSSEALSIIKEKVLPKLSSDKWFS